MVPIQYLALFGGKLGLQYPARKIAQHSAKTTFNVKKQSRLVQNDRGQQGQGKDK